KAGEGAWVKLAKFLKDHQERTPPKEKRYRELVLIRDPETRLGILLSDELPEIALVELYHLDLTAVTGNPKNAFAWRPSSQSWRPETYPAWRTDVYGWYEGPPMHPTPSPLWHLTQFPEVWPIVTLCKQVLDNPRYAPRLGGGQCQRCMVVQGIVATGHVPDWWDETNADWKSGPGRRPSSP